MYLRSSPCGPAEHCAGGSLPRSCNSWKPIYHVYKTMQDTVPYPSTCHIITTQKTRSRTYCSEQHRDHPTTFTPRSTTQTPFPRKFHFTDAIDDKKTSKLAHNSDILCTPCAQNCHLHGPVKHRYLKELVLFTRLVNNSLKLIII